MNAQHRIGQVITSLASVAGIPVSILLLLIHIHTAVGDAAGASELCTSSSTVDCSVAAASAYSEIAGIPIAAIGLAFYVAVFLVGILSPFLVPLTGSNDDRFTPAYVIFAAYTLALLDSLYLGIINFTQLDKICDKCVWLYGINLAGFIGSGLWAAGNPISAVPALIRRIPQTLRSSAFAVTLITFAVALIGGIWQTNKLIDEGEIAHPPVLIAQPVEANNQNNEYLYREHAPTIGPENATVRLVEFSDFQCPHCAHFSNVLVQLLKKYPNDLQATFRNFPLSQHKVARRVAQMGVCAQAQGNFWKFEQTAFASQQRFYDDDYSDDDLVQMMNKIGLNGDEAKDCIDSSFANKAVDQDLQDGEAVELRGTPTIFINGHQYKGRLDLESLSTIIDQAILDAHEKAAGTDEAADN